MNSGLNCRPAPLRAPPLNVVSSSCRDDSPRACCCGRSSRSLAALPPHNVQHNHPHRSAPAVAGLCCSRHRKSGLLREGVGRVGGGREWAEGRCRGHLLSSCRCSAGCRLPEPAAATPRVLAPAHVWSSRRGPAPAAPDCSVGGSQTTISPVRARARRSCSVWPQSLRPPRGGVRLVAGGWGQVQPGTCGRKSSSGAGEPEIGVA